MVVVTAAFVVVIDIVTNTKTINICIYAHDYDFIHIQAFFGFVGIFFGAK